MAKSTPALTRARTKIPAVLVDQETKNNRHWRSEFLAKLAETSNVTASADAAGVHLSRVYKVKRLEPDFARDWYDALIEGYDALELEVLHRMRFGEPVGGERKFDNGTALRLLTQHRETVTRQRAIRVNEDVATVRASIDAKLAKLREVVLARQAREAMERDSA